ncbi:hypothetical protein [Pedobacter nyackensis]|uniref:hypothetical protein n=1 Tax=Pedobacter nyackensis TaxID=475255 RepID=UPI00292CFB0B|nr:hypothetical protein [Pedobacter nyackensis]
MYEVASPFLRFERQILKPMPVIYPKKPVSIGGSHKEEANGAKAAPKDVARIFGVFRRQHYKLGKNRSKPKIQFLPHITKFLGYLPFEVDMTHFRAK